PCVSHAYTSVDHDCLHVQIPRKLNQTSLSSNMTKSSLLPGDALIVPEFIVDFESLPVTLFSPVEVATLEVNHCETADLKGNSLLVSYSVVDFESQLTKRSALSRSPRSR